MRISKTIVFIILLSSVLVNFTKAQTTENGETNCTEKFPALEIFSINEDQILFNEDDYVGFKDVRLLVFQPDNYINYIGLTCSNLQNDLGKLPFNGTWVVVIDGEVNSRGPFFKDCQEYFFKIQAFCESGTMFSDCTSYFLAGESCNNPNEISENDFIFYPQPASNLIHIVNLSKQPIESIGFFNLLGHQIYISKNSLLDRKHKIQLHELISGAYVARIVTSDETTFFKKIMIQN